MTDTERLQAINALLESDGAFHETTLHPNGVLSKIYRLVHPRFSDCKHADWEKENETIINPI